jgi:hypothetical protein
MTSVDPTRRADPKAFESEGEVAPSPPKKEPPPLPTDDGALLDFANRSKSVLVELHGARSASPPDDRILYLSMNSGSAAAELAALGSNVTNITHSAKNDTVEFGGRTYNLNNGVDVSAFAAALGVSKDVATVILDAKDGSRDELARIAIAWAPAEHGGLAPSRLVLSGHSQGDRFYGDGDELEIADVKKLAQAMPRAAAWIEDIHLAGCNTAKNGTADHASLVETFPNLRTFWAYQGSSPMAPVEHLAVWEQQTRGRADALHPSEKLMYEGVTVVDKSGHGDGYYLRLPKAEIDRRLANSEKDFALSLKGWTPLSPEPYNPLYNAYQYFQAALSRTDFTPAEQAHYSKLSEQALRLRYYDAGVRQNFQKENGAAIDTGFRAAGLTPPDFAKLSRADALAKIDEFLSLPSSKTTDLAKKLEGLRDLDPNAIPTSWCVH